MVLHFVSPTVVCCWDWKEVPTANRVQFDDRCLLCGTFLPQVSARATNQARVRAHPGKQRRVWCLSEGRLPRPAPSCVFCVKVSSSKGGGGHSLRAEGVCWEGR